MTVASKKLAWEEADKIIPNDYIKDEESTQNAGYPIFRSTVNHYDYICDLGDRLEVNTADGKTVNIWIDEATFEEMETEVLGVTAIQTGENNFKVILNNDKEIKIVKHPEHNGSIWEWKIDTQIFGKSEYAKNYLNKLIFEKITGFRIINHKKSETPCLCGSECYVTKYGCEAQTKGRYSNLCTHCPIAEALEAKRDGVKLIYAIQ